MNNNNSKSNKTMFLDAYQSYMESVLNSIPEPIGIKQPDMSSIITDYNLINDNILICTFADGTITKAICDDRDEFDMERAVEVCVMKHHLGSKKYHDMIKKGMKDIKIIDIQNAYEEEQEQIHKRKIAKKERQRARKAERERQARIDEMKEAYLGAMKEFGNREVMPSMSEKRKKKDKSSHKEEKVQDAIKRGHSMFDREDDMFLDDLFED